MNRILWRSALLVGAVVSTGTALADTSLAARPAPLREHSINASLIDLNRVDGQLIAIGDWGTILKSADGGATWSQKPSPVSAMLNRSLFISDSVGWIVGHDANILHTRDGGETWSIQFRDPEWGKPWYDIVMLDAQRGFVVGANARMMQTSDGGANWEIIEPDFTFNGTNLYGIEQLPNGTLFIHGEKGILARSMDEGATWEQLFSPYSGSFFAMLPFGETGAYLMGLRGTVFAVGDVNSIETIDPMEWDEFSLETITDNELLGPLGFRYYLNPLKESLFGGDVISDNDVLMVGVNGAVVRNEGSEMTPLETALEFTLSDALITDKGLVTVGLGGVTRVPFQR